MAMSDDFDCKVDALTVISSKASWSLSRATRLQNLDYSLASLKRYAQKIKEKLILPESMGVNMVKVNIVTLKDLKLSIEDPDALQITVDTKTRDNANFKSVCECILTSWGVEEVSSRYTSLPLLFTRGTKTFVSGIKRTLNILFGCFFTDLSFTTKDTIAFFTAVCKSIPMQHNQTVDLTYQLPNADIKHQLTISNRVIDLHRLWRCLADMHAEEGDISDDDIFFYCCFQNMIMEKFQLDLTMLELVEMKYPGLTVRTNCLASCSDPVLLAGFLNCLMKILILK